MSENEIKKLSPTELDKLLADLQGLAEPLAGETDDHLGFRFRLLSVAERVIFAEIVPPLNRVLSNGEPIRLFCGSPDGYFVLNTTLTLDETHRMRVSFLIGDEAFKIERRVRFRTNLVGDSRVEFRLQSLNRSIVVSDPQNQKSLNLHLLDISTAGMRLLWPRTGLPQPKNNDHISGTLSVSKSRQAELFGQIKSVQPASASEHGERGDWEVGVEFQNTNLRDEQLLLYVCMQLGTRS